MRYLTYAPTTCRIHLRPKTALPSADTLKSAHLTSRRIYWIPDLSDRFDHPDSTASHEGAYQQYTAQPDCPMYKAQLALHAQQLVSAGAPCPLYPLNPAFNPKDYAEL